MIVNHLTRHLVGTPPVSDAKSVKGRKPLHDAITANVNFVLHVLCGTSVWENEDPSMVTTQCNENRN